MTKRKAAADPEEAETQDCVRNLTQALSAVPPLAQYGAATVYALTAALQAKGKEDVAQWLDALAAGVRAGTIAVSSEGWRIN